MNEWYRWYMSIQEQNQPENARNFPRCTKYQKQGNQTVGKFETGKSWRQIQEALGVVRH